MRPKLAERINGVGLHCCTPVAAIRAGKAPHFNSLMRSFAPSTGLAAGPHVPAALDSSSGQFRAPQSQCQLRANSAHEALLAFIREKQLRCAPGKGLRHDNHPLA